MLLPALALSCWPRGPKVVQRVLVRIIKQELGAEHHVILQQRLRRPKRWSGKQEPA